MQISKLLILLTLYLSFILFLKPQKKPHYHTLIFFELINPNYYYKLLILFILLFLLILFSKFNIFFFCLFLDTFLFCQMLHNLIGESIDIFFRHHIVIIFVHYIIIIVIKNNAYISFIVHIIIIFIANIYIVAIIIFKFTITQYIFYKSIKGKLLIIFIIFLLVYYILLLISLFKVYISFIFIAFPYMI